MTLFQQTIVPLPLCKKLSTSVKIFVTNNLCIYIIQYTYMSRNIPMFNYLYRHMNFQFSIYQSDQHTYVNPHPSIDRQ